MSRTKAARLGLEPRLMRWSDEERDKWLLMVNSMPLFGCWNGLFAWLLGLSSDHRGCGGNHEKKRFPTSLLLSDGANNWPGISEGNRGCVTKLAH